AAGLLAVGFGVHAQTITLKVHHFLGPQSIQHTTMMGDWCKNIARDSKNTAYEMKKQGRPWCIGKAFDHSAPIGPITPIAQAGDVNNAEISLLVNGTDRQRSNVAKLIWNVAETIEHLSAAWELQAGDLIYTGTPEGVAAVVSGDMLVGEVAGLGQLKVAIK
ncbi:fumarylacetoacetate hydrolase family protein, partial [Sphingobium sp. Z007]|uniref:fumarylacetoacetate hydrolase family protein n=1 Tax=Sphingobium sp. Z007 TaxID=627495 RepID=UPI001595C813